MEKQTQGRLAFISLHALVVIAFGSAGTAMAQETDLSRCTTRYQNGMPYIYCSPQRKLNADLPSTITGSKTFDGGRAPAGVGVGSTVKGNSPLSTAVNASLKLRAVRSLIEPSDAVPRDVAGYGIVAFTTKPIQQDIERFKSVCEAYKATLMSVDELPSSVPVSDQMITFWPVSNKSHADAKRGDCAYLVGNYALGPALDAINDADKLKEGLAARRGPFLIAWAPSDSRLKPDAVVLVMELSSLESQRSFLEVFQDWRRKIVDNPQLWRNGLEVESIRRTIRDTFDRYGDLLVRLIKPSS